MRKDGVILIPEVDMDTLVKDRRRLHENPELSGMEEETLKRIRERLEQLKIPFVEVEKGGILACVDFRSGDIDGAQGEKIILLRADMDALPIEESPENLTRRKETVSLKRGVAHACGHDAHTAILLETARILQKIRTQESGSLNRRIILCFERAEENGGPGGGYGQEPLMRYLKEHHICPDACLALHVCPDLPTGAFSIEDGFALAGNIGFQVRIHGKGGHGSRPDKANHPLDCFLLFYSLLGSFAGAMLDPYKTFTFCIPQVQCGNVKNVIPEDLFFAGTARGFEKEVLEQFRDYFHECLENACRARHCTFDVDQFYLEYPLYNDPSVAGKAREVIRHMEASSEGKVRYLGLPPQFVSETFAHYTQAWPGAMTFLGIADPSKGSGAPLHAPQFDIDEDAMPAGVEYFVRFALA